MKKEEVEKLQEELTGIISCIPIQGKSPAEDYEDKNRALKIIQDLGCNHINDIVSYGSKKGTILDIIVELDSAPDVESNRTIVMGDNTFTWSNHRTRLNNKTLIELEKSVESLGGKKSEDLKNPLERIKDKIKYGAKVGVGIVVAAFIIIGIIVAVMVAIIGAIVGAIIGTVIGIGAEIKTGVNLLASKVRPNLQNTTVEQANVNQQPLDPSHISCQTQTSS